MTIVMVAPRFWPDYGGVETHVAEVSRALVDLGHTVQVISMGSKMKVGPANSRLDVIRLKPPDHNSSAWQTKWHTWRQIWQLRKAFQAADVVHVHDVAWWLWPIWLIVRSKQVITFHGWETIWPIPWQHKLHRWLVSVSSVAKVHVGAWIQEFYWDKPDLIMYGAIPHHLIDKSAPKVQVPPVDGAWQVVFVGRLADDNDVPLLIEVVKSWQATQPKVTVTWVGEGPLRSACEAVGAVTGWVDDVEKYLVNADLVLASSYLSMIEAQWHGRLVVAATTSRLKQRYLATFPNQLGLVQGQSVDEIPALVAKKIAQPTQLRSEVQAAQVWAQAQTWTAVANNYVKLYRQKIAI